MSKLGKICKLSTIHNHQEGLRNSILRSMIAENNMEDIEIAIDSTGISIYNNTPGHSKENSEDRKYRSYEQTRKLHVMLNTNSKKAIAVKYSNG
ncbi:hypothetical protein wKueTS_02820 [Wolbachia pipientis]